MPVSVAPTYDAASGLDRDPVTGNVILRAGKVELPAGTVFNAVFTDPDTGKVYVSVSHHSLPPKEPGGPLPLVAVVRFDT